MEHRLHARAWKLGHSLLEHLGGDLAKIRVGLGVESLQAGAEAVVARLAVWGLEPEWGQASNFSVYYRGDPRENEAALREALPALCLSFKPSASPRKNQP